MAHYGKIEYWEERYTRQPEPFDWYQVYNGVKDVITQYINKNDKILNIGCGNSRMSEDMYEDGFEMITNIDISHTVVKFMEEKCKTRCPSMTYKQMDVLDMYDFKQGQFNVILDKGTLDSILSGDNSAANCEKMMNEVYRLLISGGVYISITYGDPEHRLKYFKSQDWDIKTDKVAKPSTLISNNLNADDKDPKNFHYIYTMTKK